MAEIIVEEEISFMDVFLRVPALLTECTRQLVLKELRSTCKRTRAAATLQITRIVADVGGPLFSHNLRSAPQLLQSCSKLRCLGVVLHFPLSSEFDLETSNLIPNIFIDEFPR